MHVVTWWNVFQSPDVQTVLSISLFFKRIRQIPANTTNITLQTIYSAHFVSITSDFRFKPQIHVTKRYRRNTTDFAQPFGRTFHITYCHISVFLARYYWGVQTKKVAIGRVWNKRCIQGFGGETWEVRRPLERPRRRWKNTIKMDLGKVGWWAWTGST